MLSNYRYEQIRKKYKELVQYTTKESDIPEDIKKEILTIMERYRFMVGFMEENEFKELLQWCIKEKSSRPMQRGLHRLEFGVQDSGIEEGLYNDDKNNKACDIEEDYYNLRD